MQNILQEIEKKKILGRSDAWSPSRLSHRPSKPAYYIVDCRIFRYDLIWMTKSLSIKINPKSSYQRLWGNLLVYRDISNIINTADLQRSLGVSRLIPTSKPIFCMRLLRSKMIPSKVSNQPLTFSSNYVVHSTYRLICTY